MVATPEQLADEASRARKVRHLVDISSQLIMQSNLTRQDAEALVSYVRHRILELFPDGEQTYELLYTPRFKRLIDEFADRPPNGSRSVVIPFPSRSE
jgi:hypothetical protein